ncbi:hypothetical protein P154DRAFT_404110, partial [Amniculicola lignicola CBS 123094]
PEPHYSFTIPSIHDDLTLSCRIYHPTILARPRLQHGAEEKDNGDWAKKGIVMAHPYAPIGGCYDDRVVGMVMEEFLAKGWIVGTFNFRGAHGSKGRTSWSGKPEVEDYISFAGFFIVYLGLLHAFPRPGERFVPDGEAAGVLEKSGHHEREKEEDAPVVVLGGYSYGSLILKYLPPLPSILHPFAAPIAGSSAAEIVLRARKMADQSNLEWINLAQEHARHKDDSSNTHAPGRASMTIMGGEETSPDVRRSSREIRRSIDGGNRLSLDISRKIRSVSHSHLHRKKKSHDHFDERPLAAPDAALTPHLPITLPSIRYLLVSPLTPPLSTLAAPGLGIKSWRGGHHVDMIGKHPSLAVYGDQDPLSSAKKVQLWGEQLTKENGERFRAVKISGAGHFWHEEGIGGRLREVLREWEGVVR